MFKCGKLFGFDVQFSYVMFEWVDTESSFWSQRRSMKELYGEQTETSFQFNTPVLSRLLPTECTQRKHLQVVYQFTHNFTASRKREGLRES